MRGSLKIGLTSLALSAPAVAGTPTITALVLENDNVPGVGLVRIIHNLAVNDDPSWLVEADTDALPDFDTVLLRDGVLYLREGDALAEPVGAMIDGFDAINLNANGDSGWNFFLSGTGGSGDDSGIYFNDTLVIQESNVSTAPQFTAGTPYIGFFDTKFNNGNQILIMASVDDPAIPSSVDRALVVASLDGTGGLISEVVLWKEGDVLPGQTDAITDFETGPHDFDFNNGGDVIYIAKLASPSTSDQAIYLNGGLLAQEGSPSVVEKQNYEFLTRSVALNDSNNYAFRANLDGSTSFDEVIILDEGALAREGFSVAGIAPFTLTGFGLTSAPVALANTGEVVWYGEWNDPNPDIDSGLFLNEQLIVQEGVSSVDGGIIIDTIANGQDAYAISPNGRWVIFEGTLADGRDGAFLVDLAIPETVLPNNFEIPLGEFQGGDESALHFSDDVDLVIGQRAVLSPLLPLIRVNVKGFAATESASKIVVTLEASANSIPVRPPQRLSLFNYDTNLFEMVDQRIATLTDSVVEITITTDAQRFLETHTHDLEMRVEYFNPGNVFSPNWSAFIDQAIWVVTP